MDAKELKERLDIWFETVADYGEVDDVEAYEQLVQLIEDSKPKVVDRIWIMQKKDELMCDVDSGDELANYNFLLNFAKQLLSQKTPKGVDEEKIEEYWIEINYCFTGANTEAECKDSVKKIIRQLLSQKREVTREEVELLRIKVQKICHSLVGLEWGTWLEILKELGIRIEE